MKRIINPWTQTPGYNCFGCSPDNPIGTRMRFFEDGDEIVSIWRPTQNHQSWINTLHGGIQAVLLDEVCGWVVFHLLKTAGVTAKMEMRYHKPVSTLQDYIKLRAYLKEMRRNVAIVQGELYGADGELLCECVCTYFTFPQEKAKETMGYAYAQVGVNLDIENLKNEVLNPGNVERYIFAHSDRSKTMISHLDGSSIGRKRQDVMKYSSYSGIYNYPSWIEIP